MLYGEHISADEIPVKCPCGETATVEVLDVHGYSHGWHCRSCAHRKRKELAARETRTPRATILRGGRP